MKLIIDIEPRYCKNMRSDVRELYYEAINRIIEAVSNGKPYEDNPQGDLISRNALKKSFAETTYIRFTADMGQGGYEMFSEKEIEKIIDRAPIVTPEITVEQAIAKIQETDLLFKHNKMLKEWADIRCAYCNKMSDSQAERKTD